MGHSGEIVMVVRGGREAFDLEAEPVTIVRQGLQTLLILDDGERLEFQTGELLAAVLDEHIVAELVARVLRRVGDRVGGPDAQA